MIVGLTASLAFIVWQYLMPASFESIRVLNHRALGEWRLRLGLHQFPPAFPLGLYATLFRTWMVGAWVAYAALVGLVFWGARFGAAWTWRLAVPVVAIVAVAMPPTLSTDVFAYVGYARLAVVYHLNPHVATQGDLVRLGDPTAPYLYWAVPSSYGPLWTLISMGVVKLMPAGSVLGAVLVLKLIAGGALLVAAQAARCLCRHLDPERADTTFVVVAMNPLLLWEGSGNGHNDLAMTALLMVGFAAWFGAPSRPRWAALAIGGAVAVKLIPLLTLPWLALAAARAAPPRPRSRIFAVLVVAVLGLAPLVAVYVPFWSGGRALDALAQRRRAMDAVADRAAAARVAVGGVAAARPARAASSSVEMLKTTWPAVLVYAAASALLFFRRRADGDGAGRLDGVTAWVYVALAVMMFLAGLWFPWYLAWAWPAIVLRWNRQHALLFAFIWSFSLLLMLVYAIGPT